MTSSQSEKLAGRLKKQVALIEKVCAAHHFSYQDLGERIAVTRDTIRKYAGGYQPASERVMELIAQLISSSESAKPEKLAVNLPNASKPEKLTESNTLTEKLLYVLERGTPEEGTLVRAFIETAHRQVLKRQANHQSTASLI